MKSIILGSQSPRRKEILGYFDIPFQQVPSQFDEDSIPFKEPAAQYAAELSQRKALALKPQFPDQWILTADTIVYCDGQLYGKPRSLVEAQDYLRQLQGKWHSVYSGVTLLKEKETFTDFEETRVLFNPLNQDQIRKYHDKTLWSDKSGGYTIQMSGGMIVQKIDGCYYNVTGLPINTVRKLFLLAGIDLWDHLR